MTRIAVLALVVAACSSSPADVEPDGGDGDADADVDATTDDTQFGVRLEPPRGRVIHGQGQWEAPSGNPAYITALADPALAPAIAMTFWSIDAGERPIAGLRNDLARHVTAGRVPQLNLALRGVVQPVNPITSGDPLFGLDDEIVMGSRWDANIRDIAHAVRDTGVTMWVRIGGEFNGYWEGQHPGIYPLAYRKVVEMFRDEGAANAVFVWCYAPAAPGDFDAIVGGEPKWYPGDDVVDWFGIDVFHAHELVGNEKAERFLAMAVAKQKPVIVAESSAAFVDLTPGAADGQADWDAWFAPYFAWIAANPVIEAFQYINFDWPQAEFYAAAGWKNANINVNTVVRDRFVEVLREPKFLHLPEVQLLAQ